jgi:small-conductance mechanosensitive channel
LLERSIKIDDVIEIDGKIARVMDIGIRSTRVRTLFEEDIILPNSFLVQQPIKNLTLHDSLIRIAVHVGVSYSSDLALVRRTLEKVAAEVPDTDPKFPPRVLLEEFGASSVSYEVSVWTHDPWNHRLTRSTLREAIWAAFKREGVVIAFPQVDVHFDGPVVESLKKIAA